MNTFPKNVKVSSGLPGASSGLNHLLFNSSGEGGSGHLTTIREEKRSASKGFLVFAALILLEAGEIIQELGIPVIQTFNGLIMAFKILLQLSVPELEVGDLLRGDYFDHQLNDNRIHQPSTTTNSP